MVFVLFQYNSLISSSTLEEFFNMKFATALKSTLGTAAVACLALVAGSTSAAAATATTQFQVSATIQATCIVSATPMAFGTYAGAAVASTSTVTVTCTNTTPYHLQLDQGLATGATVTTRKMQGPSGALLNYGLFQDSGHTINWGKTDGTDDVAGTGNGSAQALTLYGQVAAGQYLAPGNYTDTITATINY
jgi:spore coat protein U-like protein